MILLLAVMMLAPSSQLDHEAAERAIYSRLRAYKAQIDDIWRPSKQLQHDYSKAHDCWVKFHLGKVSNCDRELEQLGQDLKREH